MISLDDWNYITYKKQRKGDKNVQSESKEEEYMGDKNKYHDGRNTNILNDLAKGWQKLIHLITQLIGNNQGNQNNVGNNGSMGSNSKKWKPC